MQMVDRIDSQGFIRTEVPLRQIFHSHSQAPVVTFGSIPFPEAQRLHRAAALDTAGPTSAITASAYAPPEALPPPASPPAAFVFSGSAVDALLDPRLRAWPDDTGRERYGRPASLHRGLLNLSNTCYANVVLQTLQLCPCLRQVCGFVREHGEAAAFEDMPILRALASFIDLVNPSQQRAAVEGNGPARPDVVLAQLQRFFTGDGSRPHLERSITSGEIRVVGPQQDAQEFLGFVLDALQDEQVATAKKWGSGKTLRNGHGGEAGDHAHDASGNGLHNADGADDGWMEAGKGGKKAEVRDVGESQESIISALFQGTLRSILRTGGSKQSVTLQPFYTLPLEVSNRSISSLQDAIDQYMEPSYVDINQSKRQKLLQFDRLPLVFVFHLKRFAYSRATATFSKIRKAIHCPSELTLPDHLFTARYKMAQQQRGDSNKREVYQLYSVVLHKGTQIAVGHYTNYTYDFFNNQWLYFDDHNVYPVKECPLDHPDAYLLFYVNKDLVTPKSNYVAS